MFAAFISNLANRGRPDPRADLPVMQWMRAQDLEKQWIRNYNLEMMQRMHDRDLEVMRARDLEVMQYLQYVHDRSL